MKNIVIFKIDPSLVIAVLSRQKEDLATLE
jgi:hypothetical protein